MPLSAGAEPLQAAVDRALPGSTILLAPGVYAPVTVSKPLALVAREPGTAIIRGPADRPLVHVRRTHDVTLQGLRLEGGHTGILVEGSQLVRIMHNQLQGAERAGIRLSDASGQVVGNEVGATRGPYGTGIELANTHSRPPSLIAHNWVWGQALAGIDLRNAEATIRENLITDNGLRGIAVAEMSLATVRANRLLDNADAAIHVIDMSHALLQGNTVLGVRPGPWGWADGIRVEYHAEAVLEGNLLEVAPARELALRSGGTVRQR